MSCHPLVEKITSWLKENSIEFESFEHEPVRTSEEAARVRTGYTLHQGAKTAVLRVKEAGKGKRFVMLLMPGDKKFSTAKVKKNLGFSDLRFATEEEVGQITGGVLPGGVPPFGNLFGLEIFADPSVFENERIIFNAGDRSFSIAMRSSDYRKLTNPKIIEIIE